MKLWDRMKSQFSKKTKRSSELSLSAKKPAGKKRIWLPLLIPFILGIILIFLFPRGHSFQFSDLTVGSISPRRIVAPFSFEILKTREEYQQDRLQVIQSVNPVFTKNEQETQRIENRIVAFFQAVGQMRRKSVPLSAKIDSLSFQFPIFSLTPEHWRVLLNPEGILTPSQYHTFQNQLGQIVRDISRTGILNQNKSLLVVADGRLILRDQEEETMLPIEDFFDLESARIRANELLDAYYGRETSLAQIGAAVISYYLRPNILNEEALNQERISEAQSRIPLSSGFVYEDELIVDRNQRVTADIRKRLDSLSAKMVEKGMLEGGISRIFPLFGKIAFVFSLLFLFAFYLAFENRKLLEDAKSLLLLSLIILLMALSAFLIRRLEASEYLMPSAIGAMLLASIFGTRIAYAGTAILSLLVSALWGNEFNLMAVSFFTGIFGILIIKRVRTRGQLVQAVFYMMVIHLVTITMMGFIRFLPFNQIVHYWQFGALNGLFTPIIAYGMLALIESLFDMTTDYALLELSNLNHPLLKRLSVEAPGTYHHSILVGNMAEAAAQAVGANSLLARVGCYYHDIGKLEKAEYFVENQVRSENPHKKLAPSMSALILINHVKRGIELAERYRLPKAIRDIMTQHHGKTIMTFFYQKALAKVGAEGVNETEYRYPGPLPQSKEAAIVMLADAIEAASRTLKEPTYSRLKGLIEDIVDERFQAGELDQSPLTLRDLERIKESFLKILAGTFHARIEYPDADELKSVRRTGETKKEAGDGPSN
ncbi:MAG TPA: HDIG domain-containing protein [bacterium]|nr:HDIG domain-containing protein [bacterium]